MAIKRDEPAATNRNGGIIQEGAPVDGSNVLYVHEVKPPEK